ncbi:MAG: MlaD family protein [Candidatus Omnitrophota bacterium]
MKKNTNEFKVGLFVVICILGLFYLSYSTGKLNFKKEGYYIYATFGDIAGLAKKAPVMLNGLEVGKVEDIKISYEPDKTCVILKLWIENKVKVRENPEVSIKTLGLMGEKYIQISSLSGGEFIKPESTIMGNEYTDFDALAKEVQDISGEVKKLTTSLNSAMDNNKESIDKIVKNLETTSKNFEEFSADIKKHPWKLLFKSKDKKAK